MMRRKLPEFFPGPAMSGHLDWDRDEDAKILAKRIKDVWHKCGHYDVDAWTMRVPYGRPGGKNEKAIYAVKTNLINGLPPSFWRS